MIVFRWLFNLSFGDWCAFLGLLAALSPIWGGALLWMRTMARHTKAIAMAVQTLPITTDAVRSQGFAIDQLKTITTDHGEQLTVLKKTVFDHGNQIAAVVQTGGWRGEGGMTMHLEAVTVCVDYADFLREAIPFNQPLFDRWVIVTTEEDAATRHLCHKHGLECLMTADFFRNGHKFNKGRGVARGLEHLSHDDWLLHLDADMVLPRMTRQFLEAAHLDPKTLYGVDRAMVNGWDAWQRLKQLRLFAARLALPGELPRRAVAGLAVRDDPRRLQSDRRVSTVARVGGRVPRAPHAAGGYYNGDASHDDVRFALQWDRRQRALIPELIAFHLASTAGKDWGANWGRRKSPPFGPPIHTGSETRVS